jgi:hypothetical protein
MANKITIKLPDIPRNVSAELYNYFAQLHQNLKTFETAINAQLEKEGK